MNKQNWPKHGPVVPTICIYLGHYRHLGQSSTWSLKNIFDTFSLCSEAVIYWFYTFAFQCDFLDLWAVLFALLNRRMTSAEFIICVK